VIGNVFGPNKTGSLQINSSSVNYTASSNAGYITRKSASSTLLATTTSLVVSHGLSRAPSLANIRIQANASTAAPLYVSAVTATTFTVSTATVNPGDLIFSWEANAEQVA